MDYYEWVRLANLSLAVVICVLTVLKQRLLWHALHVPARLMYNAWLFVMLAVAYGSAEAYVRDVEPGFRVSFAGAALIVGLVAFVWPDDDLNWMTFWRRIWKR